MKILLKITFVFLTLSLCSSLSAQSTLKLAHINAEELIMSMSDYDTAMVKFQKVQKEFETELETLSVELNRKIDEFQKNSETWTDLVKQSRQDDIISMQQRIQTYRQGAQENLEQEYNKLMQPVYEKVNKAIEAVAKEQNITYVLNAQVLSYRSADATDLLPAVKKHLGITK
jgi:outer membrane protein